MSARGHGEAAPAEALVEKLVANGYDRDETLLEFADKCATRAERRKPVELFVLAHGVLCAWTHSGLKHNKVRLPDNLELVHIGHKGLPTLSPEAVECDDIRTDLRAHNDFNLQPYTYVRPGELTDEMDLSLDEEAERDRRPRVSRCVEQGDARFTELINALFDRSEWDTLSALTRVLSDMFPEDPVRLYLTSCQSYRAGVHHFAYYLPLDVALVAFMAEAKRELTDDRVDTDEAVRVVRGKWEERWEAVAAKLPTAPLRGARIFAPGSMLRLLESALGRRLAESWERVPAQVDGAVGGKPARGEPSPTRGAFMAVVREHAARAREHAARAEGAGWVESDPREVAREMRESWSRAWGRLEGPDPAYEPGRVSGRVLEVLLDECHRARVQAVADVEKAVKSAHRAFVEHELAPLLQRRSESGQEGPFNMGGGGGRTAGRLALGVGALVVAVAGSLLAPARQSRSSW